MGSSADCTLSLGRFLTLIAEHLATDGVADTPPPVELIAVRLLGLTRERLDIEYGRQATPDESDLLRRVLDQIAAGEPAAYILGAATFLGREFEVTRDTLIPRRDTEGWSASSCARSALARRPGRSAC